MVAIFKVGMSDYDENVIYMPLSEVPPAVISDSAAPSMQHMAVARDFLLPNPAN